MATIEFINRKNKTYEAMKRVINYITRSDKTEEDLVYGNLCNKDNAYDDFVQLKQMYGKEKGRQYIHFVQSFSPDEDITPELANEIARRLISHPVFDGFQVLIATHTDTPHIHTHFVINTVNSETGEKWHKSKYDLQAIKDYSDELCREYGLNVINNENKEKGHQSSGEYRSKQKGTSWKYELFLAVTACMKTATSREEFINKMNELGYQVIWKDDKTYVTFITPDGKKCRNKKLYPPERFTKENMEKVFEENRKRLDRIQSEKRWNMLVEAIYLFGSNTRKNNRSSKYPLSKLEGEALKEYMLLHDNEGEIDWSEENENEADFEL